MAKPRYYAVNDLKKVVCSTQRAGSNSIAEALRPAYNDSQAQEITKAEAFARRSEGWPVLLWLRDPLEKFASAYRIFGRNLGSTVEKFASYAMEHDDAHWAPQTQMHRRGGMFLPTKVMPFSDIAATWAEELPGYTLEHKNKSAKKAVQLPADLIARLRTHFKGDIDMLATL
jgi:hypothetical protein